MRLAIRGLAVTMAAACVVIGGAVASTGPEVCSTVDRPACLTISDTDDVSRSTESSSRYGMFSFAVRNAGAIKLHTTLTLKLVDVTSGEVVDAEQPTSAAFASPLPAGCVQPAYDELVCTVPGIDPEATHTVGPALVRTSTNESAQATRVHATLWRAPKPNSDETPVLLLTSSEDMVYGAVGDASKSVIFANASTSLETSTDDVQSSFFPIVVPASFEGFVLATIAEFDPGDEEYFCPVELCFGQSVETFAPGVFSPTHPANLRVRVARSAAKHISPRNLKVHHRRQDGSTVVITASCRGAIGTAPPAGSLPCRRVSLDTVTQIITIDVWDVDQGDWGFS